MSENEPRERPITLSWPTIMGMLALLFSGFMAFLSLSENDSKLQSDVTAIEKELEMQRNSHATKGELESAESRIGTKVDRIHDLLCEDPQNERRRACRRDG